MLIVKFGCFFGKIKIELFKEKNKMKILVVDDDKEIV